MIFIHGGSLMRVLRIMWPQRGETHKFDEWIIVLSVADLPTTPTPTPRRSFDLWVDITISSRDGQAAKHNKGHSALLSVQWCVFYENGGSLFVLCGEHFALEVLNTPWR